MKLKLPTLLILLLTTSMQAMAQCWSEVWKDDFNGTSLNTADWNYELGNGCPSLCGWGNSEKEYYTNSTSNVSVSGGNLTITAQYSANYAGSGSNFTSGKINTKNKQTFKYGKFEARMKLPSGTGTWPAFWMLPQSNAYGGWPTSGEIDIMENRGDQTTKIGGTLHYGNAYPQDEYDGNTYTLSSGDFVNSFHIFTAEWDPSQIRFYVDGVLYKTETKSPNSLSPASNNAVVWPWDQDFYIILNLAVGGLYTGNPSDAAVNGGNTSWSATMLVDYVKAYTDLSGGALTGSISGETSITPNESNVTYSIPATSGATYAWTVTSGTIASGQGTDIITVNWGSSSGNVSVVKTLSCGGTTYNLPVTVMPVLCGTMLEDFENIRPVNNYNYMNGQLTQKVANPGSSAENTSPLCGQYIRSSTQYDVLIFMNPNVGNADLIKSGAKRFIMDVYSNGAGRNVQITLENSSMNSGAYPAGRHSYYVATTTKVNQWETLTFNWGGNPDASVVGTSIDQLTFSFENGTTNTHTFYFDNLLLTSEPLSGTLSGASTVCNNQTNVNYTISSHTGYTYNWTVPTGATITSGQGTNSIQTIFGTSGGTISVVPTNLGCTGAATTQPVINNICTSTTGTTEADMTNTALFPNPAGENISIKLNNQYEEGLVKIQIMESTGKIISEMEYPSSSGNELSVPVSMLKTGYYLVRITNGDYSTVKGFFKK